MISSPSLRAEIEKSDAPRCDHSCDQSHGFPPGVILPEIRRPHAVDAAKNYGVMVVLNGVTLP
jgi:hypothetical protein